VNWLKGGPPESKLSITQLSKSQTAYWIIVAGFGTMALGGGMDQWTNAALPYWDAAITVMSLIAQWLLARKVLENWPFWIAVDVLAIGVYTAKDLYITAGLYAVFLGLATWGWIEWKGSFKRQELERVLA
jgi:nicotinamide mononucleotide transporter